MEFSAPTGIIGCPLPARLGQTLASAPPRGLLDRLLGDRPLRRGWLRRSLRATGPRDHRSSSAGQSFPLAFGRTPAVVAEVALWRLVEVDLCEPKHLPLVDMVDVDTHVSHQLRRDIRSEE